MITAEHEHPPAARLGDVERSGGISCAPQRPRQAARLPRQRRDEPEAPSSDRRAHRLLFAENSNVHGRAPAEREGDASYEAGRAGPAFLNAADTREIVFVRGATRASTVAASYGRTWVGRDEIIISALNITRTSCWQILCEEKGAVPARDPSTTT